MLSTQRVNTMVAITATTNGGKPNSEKERNDYQTDKVVLKVGTHDGCGGMIMYASQFVEIRDHGKDTLGPSQCREKVKCTCSKCKLKFNPYFLLYRDQVIAWRERTD